MNRKLNMKNSNWALFALFFAAVCITGCHKRVASTPPPPPAPAPAPVAPTVSLNAAPADITRGNSTTLSWSSTNANQLTLTPELGSVSPNGSREINPGSSTTYTITAIGNGGRAEASARVTVNRSATSGSGRRPERNVPGSGRRTLTSTTINPTFAPAIANRCERMPYFSTRTMRIRFTIEGHCDERGSEEYNLGLGDRRANAAKQYMVSMGIGEDRIQTTSYGKERPFCTEHNEACWQQNRRAHFVMNR